MNAVNEKEAAAIVGVSVRTLQAWRQRGTGPSYIKLGAKVAYPVAFLREYIAAQMVLIDEKAAA